MASPTDRLSTGTVTFLFSDIEGSTRLAQTLGPDVWINFLRDHDALVDRTVADAGGIIVKHEGDGVFSAFAEPLSALVAAAAFSRALGADLGPDGQPRAKVRIGIHTGVGRLTESGQDYVGIDVHYAARVAAAANGGQIAVSEATLAATGGAIPDGTRLVAIGPRRLKDFEDPRPIHLLVVPGAADDERPIRTIDTPSNLPTPPTNFVGRDGDLAELGSILAGTRLLTLAGPGGTGKTRLALALAASVVDAYPGGTWFVDLAPVRDPALIQSTIATTLDVREEPGVPITRTLQAHLRPLRLLLLLDNLEQLLPSAADDVSTLLRSCPGLRIVVTSREVLRVTGEFEYQVSPLDAAAGVRLFLDRSRLVRVDVANTEADLDAVRRIVDRLEGLPLAIELAAARVRVLSPTAILQRLETSLDLLAGGARDLPERQRTLRAAIAWSHDLLSDDEQAIFRRVAVFAGGWTTEIAQVVVDPDMTLSVPVIDGLEALCDKSLVRVYPGEHGEPRFDRHTLLREFATERLDASGERPDCERRHAMCFLGLSESVGATLIGPDAEDALDIVDHELHNIRSAMRWSLTNDEPAVGLRIAAAIWRYWQLRSQLAEGSAWTNELLAHRQAREDRLVRIGALSAAGGIAYWSNDFPKARSAYDERLTLAEATGDDRLIADAHFELGFMGMVDEDVEFLRRHEAIALDMFERIGFTDGVVRARQAFVLVHFLSAEFAEARDLERLNLAEFQRTGARYLVSDSMLLMAVASIFMGDLPAGREYLTGSVRLTSGILTDQIAGLVVASHLALRADLAEDGARLAGAAAAVSEGSDVTNAALSVLHVPDPADLVRQRLGSDADRYLDEGRAMGLEPALDLARRIASPT